MQNPADLEQAYRAALSRKRSFSASQPQNHTMTPEQQLYGDFKAEYERFERLVAARHDFKPASPWRSVFRRPTSLLAHLQANDPPFQLKPVVRKLKLSDTL
jgi:hypothetical protein